MTKFKNPAAMLLGSMTSQKKVISSRENGKKGGFWRQKRNRNKSPQGLNTL